LLEGREIAQEKGKIFPNVLQRLEEFKISPKPQNYDKFMEHGFSLEQCR